MPTLHLPFVASLITPLPDVAPSCVTPCAKCWLFASACCCRRGVSNQVQLSAYPDCIGEGLADLSNFLRKHIDGEQQPASA